MTENNKDNKQILAERGILQLNLKEETSLYACFMPFVKGCGLFFPGISGRSLGEELFLLLRLPGQEERFAVAAKVVWLNPKQKLGKRLPGVGFQLMGRDAERIRGIIEEILGKKINSPLSTATM
ncbi:MAG: pilus assembly protein PilZ [Gammaproteobacteria bacterium]|nr:pilus assembly protein PilZ [Gammaproteobacteria bacterium]